jgi:hypothetical protein
MSPLIDRANSTVVRRVYEAWSIEIPLSFTEAFIEDDGYWHAYDEDRSVSLTSITLTDQDGRPATAEEIARQVPPVEGDPFDELPPGLPGWAFTLPAIQPARASRSLSGVVATDGRLLLATITADDEAWARRTWLSIRCHRVERSESHGRSPH